MVREGGGGVDRPNPSEGVVGSEGKEAWELKGSTPQLLVLGIGVGVSYSGGATQAGGSAAEIQWRRGFLVSSGRGEVARELREDEAELVVGLIEGGEGRRRGFDGESSSLELGRAAEAFWGFWAGSERKGEGN